jgi:WD40 repeat protein
VNALAWSPDGAWLATASSDRTARIWDTTTWQTATNVTTHTSRVRAVAWSPGSTRIATACGDGLIIFWSIQGGEATSIAMQTAFCLAWWDDLIAIGHVGPPTLVKLTDDRQAETSEPRVEAT